jgi:photosystem II stability/assembly factor-like uncharacterized protein
MLRYVPLILLFCSFILGGCDTATDPDNPSGGDTTTIVMSKLADLPVAGGDATGIAVAPDGRIIAVIDGKLYAIPAAGGAPQIINGDAVHTNVAVAPSGEIYALTPTEFRTYAPGTTTPTIVPIDPAGPRAIGRRVEDSEIIFSPSGEPFITFINNTPQSYTYYSTDKGETWKDFTLMNGSGSMQYGGDVAFMPNGDIIAADYKGLYKTTDQGATWASFPPPLDNYAGKLLVTSNGDIYYWVKGGGGLKVSHDGGGSFSDLSQFNRAPYFISIRQGNDGALYALANRSAVGHVPIARPMSLLKSTDGGTTWQHLLYVQGHELATRGTTLAVGLVGSLDGSARTPGGVNISQNMGTTWSSNGLNTVGKFQDIGFDRDGNLMLIADQELFRKTTAGWQTVGSQGFFNRFTTTPQGNLLIATPSTAFFSSDNGTTWNEKEFPDYLYGGIGGIVVPVVVGKRDNEFLVSVTTYRDDLGTHTNGALYKVGGDGVPSRITGVNGNFVKIIEDKDKILYAATVNFADALKSTDGGATWQVQPKGTPAIAINSSNKFISNGEMGTYRIGTMGSDETRPLKMSGFTTPGNLISSIKFDRNDQLYIVTANQELYISQSPLK